MTAGFHSKREGAECIPIGRSYLIYCTVHTVDADYNTRHTISLRIYCKASFYCSFTLTSVLYSCRDGNLLPSPHSCRSPIVRQSTTGQNFNTRCLEQHEPEQSLCNVNYLLHISTVRLSASLITRRMPPSSATTPLSTTILSRNDITPLGERHYSFSFLLLNLRQSIEAN